MITIRTSFRPAGPAEIADSAFEILRRGLAPMLAISVVVNVPLFVTVAALAWWIRERGLLWGSPRYFAGLAVLSLALGAAAWLRAIGTGALAHASLIAITGREPSAGASLSAALRLGSALSSAIAIRFAAVAIGSLACLLPAPVIAGSFAFVTHAIVLEKRPLFSAFVRSTRVAPHGGGGLFAAALLASAGWIIAALQILMLTRLLGVVGNLAVPAIDVSRIPQAVLLWSAIALAKIAVDPLVSAAAASAWVDALIRADGLDLELRAQRLTGEPLLVDPEVVT